MRRELLIPKLGLTMTEGLLVEWMVEPGKPFKENQGLFVVESEKAANEVGAEADGVLLEIVAQVGETLACGTVIGYWDDGQPEEVSAPPKTPNFSTAPTAVNSAPAVIAPVKPLSIGATTEQRIPVTPLARRLAAQLDIDLVAVVGSGARGRIRSRDVLAHKSDLAQTAPKQSACIASGVLRAPSGMERTIAQRLTMSKQQIPHFYLSVETEMSAVMALRAQINAEKNQKKFTLTHFLLAAVGQSLVEMPEVNQVWTDDGILRLAQSDVGLAVNTDKGLVVPVLSDVGRLSLSQIAKETTERIQLAQTGCLKATDMQGGAITISNAGMHDVTYMSSIINPGQSMILGVGSVREVFRPDENGRPVIRREMGMVLSADHRVLDGVTALKFLNLVVKRLQKPLHLLLT